MRFGVVVPVAGVAVLAAVSACSSAGPAALRGNPQAVVRASVDRTLAMGSARVAVTVGADLAGTGTVNFHSDEAHLAFGRTGTAAHLGDHFEVVSDGPTEWLKASGQQGGLPGTSTTQPWVEGSPEAVTNATYERVDPLGTVLVRPGLGTDLAFLRGAVDVTGYGGFEVEGANTYRYTIDVDMQAAIAASPPSEQPALEAAAQAIGPVVWPADVWLDTSGRVREVQMALNPFTHTTTTKPNLFITEDGNYLDLTNIIFDEFGTRAAISPPAPEEAVHIR